MPYLSLQTSRSSSFKRLTATAVVSLCAALAPTGYAADAGTIDRVSGNATVTNGSNQTRRALANEKVQSGETVTTESGSEALIKMADNSVVALRANTQIRFAEFRYEQKPTDTSVSNLLRGTARFVTGLLGKQNPANVRLVARTATIGIRGTDYEVALIDADSADTRAGIYNFVHDGATNVQLAQGPASDVRKDQTAFAPANVRPGESALQILDSRPVFLQSGGGFDALMQSITSMPLNVIQQMPQFR